MTWIGWAALALGVLVAGLFGLAAYGSSRWAGATRVLIGQLDAARLPMAAKRYDARELEGLPAPVQRYFRAVLKDGQPIITGVTVQHTGTFNVTAFGNRALWLRSKPSGIRPRCCRARVRLGLPSMQFPPTPPWWMAPSA